ncbi:MAG TPA: histidine phosphatase family protein [Anaerolineaceae bacterium]|nr:histidine phosphatase family protein [Anaerolineaceae bacterium]
MTELWLVRHGQTDWNTEFRIQGSIDKSLNAIGIEQAHAIAKKLKDTHFDAIYSSPAKRAYQTASAIAQQLGLTIRTDKRLKEISLGLWEGLTWQQVQERYPEMFLKRKADPVHFAPEGAETYGDLARRMVQAANEIALSHPGERVLVVSHGMSLATLLSKARGTNLADAYDLVPQNATPVVIEWEMEHRHN